MPNVMAALPNIGGAALCSTPQSLADAHGCSTDVQTRNPLKFAGVPQTRQRFSADIGPKFTILRGHVEAVLMFNKFFCDCRQSIHALVAKIWPDKVVRFCRDGDFLHTVFSASRVQHISDMYSKFALRPHHVWKYGRHPIADR